MVRQGEFTRSAAFFSAAEGLRERVITKKIKEKDKKGECIINAEK
jgi:hypothetical protein